MVETQNIKIHGIAHGGAGVGRVDGSASDSKVWFVDDALPGEVVEAQVDSDAKRYVKAHCVSVIQPSPDRVEPACQYASECGGCAWQTASLSAQLRYKTSIVNDQLRKLGISVNHAVASPASEGYRRRARLHYTNILGELRLGFLRRRSHETVDVETCRVLEPVMDKAIQRVRGLAKYLPESGELFAISDGHSVVLGLPGLKPDDQVAAACEKLIDDSLVGFVLRGKRTRRGVGQTTLLIDEQDGGPAVVAGPFVFAQAQAAQNRALVDHVRTKAECTEQTVLELYAGSGNFTRVLAADAKKLLVVESSREAVNDLRILGRRSATKADVLRSTVETTMERLNAKNQRFDVVVLDPPRAGLGINDSHRLARMANDRIVYVSCDPATLARDIAVLTERGFAVRDVRLFDMMPMTPEVEVVATLERLPAS